MDFSYRLSLFLVEGRDRGATGIHKICKSAFGLCYL